MAIYRRLAKASFDDAATKCMTKAYEETLAALRLADRNDPLTDLIAAKIIEMYRTGEHDTAKLSERVMAALGVSRRQTSP